MSSLLIEQCLEITDKRWHENIFKEKFGLSFCDQVTQRAYGTYFLVWEWVSDWIGQEKGQEDCLGRESNRSGKFYFLLNTNTCVCTIFPAWFLLSDTHKRYCWLNSDSVLPDSNFRIKEEPIAVEFTEATTGMCLAVWVCIVCLCVSVLSIPLNNEANTHFTASFCYLLVFLIPYNCCFESRHNPGSCRDMLYPVPGICKWKLVFHLFLLTLFFLP